MNDGRVDSTGNYMNGKKDGEWIEFNDNREVEIKGTYKDGKKDGLWIWPLDYGKKEIIYKNNEIVHIYFDDNEIWIPKHLDRKIPKSECMNSISVVLS